MKLTVKHISGKISYPEIDPTATVNNLKEYLIPELPEGTDLDQIKIIYQGKVLLSTQSLASYQVNEDKFLVLMLSKKSKPPSIGNVDTNTGSDNTHVSSNPAEEKVDNEVDNEVDIRETTDQMEIETFLSTPQHLLFLAKLIFPNDPDIETKIQNPIFCYAIRTMLVTESELLTNPKLMEAIRYMNAHPNEEIAYQEENSNNDSDNNSNNDSDNDYDNDYDNDSDNEELSEYDQLNINQLVNLGFDEDAVITAYLICNKNVERTADYLFENS